MNPELLDRIETFVKADRECTEDDVAIALDIHIFDALEGLGGLQRLGRLRRKRCRSWMIKLRPSRSSDVRMNR